MKDKVLGLTYSSQDNTNPQRRKEPPAVEVEMLRVVDVDVAVVVAAAAAELAAAELAAERCSGSALPLSG